MTTPRSLSLGALAVGACLFLATTSNADTCCYSVCGSAPRLTQVALLVTCEPKGRHCPRTTGACGVWAQSTPTTPCSDPTTCGAGTHGGRDAEALLGRLVGNPTFQVVRPVEFLLSNGAWIGFRPAK